MQTLAQTCPGDGDHQSRRRGLAVESVLHQGVEFVAVAVTPGGGVPPEQSGAVASEESHAQRSDGSPSRDAPTSAIRRISLTASASAAEPDAVIR